MTRIPAGSALDRTFLGVLSILAATVGLVGCGSQTLETPNLVLISVDRLSADRLGCFGGDEEAGGALCALGENGTLFAWTVSPGRAEASAAATLLTGLPEAEHRVGESGQSFLVDRHRSLAEDLAAAGYSTAAFVATPRVNRSRRLDQGFDHYDDRRASPNRNVDGKRDDLSSPIRNWIEAARSPWFVWVHADRDIGLVALDRLLSRLSQTFESSDKAPGVLFVALRGEPVSAADDGAVSWSANRVPLIWHPPASQGAAAPPVSFRLASLRDVAPTLRASAGLRRLDEERPQASAGASNTAAPARPTLEPGRDLTRWSRLSPTDSETTERFIALESVRPNGEVGLASATHLYARRSSLLDGTGRPVPTDQLRSLEARFTTLPVHDRTHDPNRDPTGHSASLEPGPWRTDILGAGSPVPQLEFHLAQQLGFTDDLRRINRDAP